MREHITREMMLENCTFLAEVRSELRICLQKALSTSFAVIILAPSELPACIFARLRAILARFIAKSHNEAESQILVQY